MVSKEQIEDGIEKKLKLSHKTRDRKKKFAFFTSRKRFRLYSRKIKQISPFSRGLSVIPI